MSNKQQERIFMDYIKYETTLKASGNEYKKIVFWNRFIRNPIELILTWLPAAISVICISLGFFSSYLAVIYAACWCYPLFIFFIQFKNSVNYHLKNREPSESAPCTMTLMENGILAEIPEYDVTHQYSWKDFTTVYNKFGYYMLFQKGKMLVMLRQKDMPEKERAAAADFIKKNVDLNVCRVMF